MAQDTAIPAYHSYDQLGFEEAYADLHSLIVKLPLPNVLGFYGPWGSGKTKIIEHLAKDLDNKGYPTLIFDAWQCKDDARLFPSIVKWFCVKQGIFQLPRDFIWIICGSLFLVLIGAVFILLRGIWLLIGGIALDIALVAALLMFLTKTFAFCESLIDFFAPQSLEKPTSSEEVDRANKQFKKLVNDAIHKKSKADNLKDRAIIFIDNLDRCLPGKVVDLIEDIRSYFDLPNCLFVLVMDKQNVISAIEQRHAGFIGRSYLEKIVRAGFGMPIAKVAGGKNAINYFKFCFYENYKNLTGNDIKQAGVAHFDEFLAVLLSASFLNAPRRIERLAYGFARANMNQIHSEMDSTTLIIALVIKEYFPKVYFELRNGDEKIFNLFITLMSWSISGDHTAARIRRDPDVVKGFSPASQSIFDEYLNCGDFDLLLRKLEDYKQKKKYHDSASHRAILESLQRSFNMIDLID